MAISAESREEFQTKQKPLRDKIDECLAREKEVLEQMKKDPNGAEIKKLALCEEMIFVSTLYININNLSVQIIEAKNNDALNDARKIIYKAIIYLEETVSNAVDIAYTDQEPFLAKIANVPLEKRFYIVKKLGLVIQLLADAFGDNSKWKWTFVEIRGRFAVVAKNLIDMKKASRAYYDPNNPEYENTVLYVRLIRSLLDKSATEYRDKYELSTRRLDDMRIAINFLYAARRIAMILGDKEEAEELKKKSGVWKEKLDADTKSGTSK